jgi:hypothetical protein
MDHVSRPLLIALAAVVALAALWLVALKPHGSSSSSPAPAKSQVAAQPATPKPAAPRPAPRVVKPKPDHHAVAAHRSARAAAASRARHAAPRPVALPRSTGPASRLGAVEQALASRQVLALLFYNPGGADDQAVRQELASVSAHGGKVFKLAVPLPEVSSYAAVTNQVPVNISPTLVIIDRSRHAQEIVGFADSFEIDQRLQDALAVPVALR